MTGFSVFEAKIGDKWLGLLKELAPKLVRSATLFDPDDAPQAPAFLRSVEAASRVLGMETAPAPVRSDFEIEPVVESLGRNGDGALIVLPDGFNSFHRQAIIRAAESHRVPAIYPYREFADDGGLMVYTVDVADQTRSAAAYADRILRGANPAELPVQEPTKYQLIINLKTAKALGITFPPTLLVRADQVIE